MSGTTTFAGISASSLTVSGNATVNGTTTLKGTSLTGTLTIVNTASANNNTVGLLIGNSGNGKQLRCMIDGFQAWNGTAVSNLHLNYWGGPVYFGTNTVSINGGVITSQNIKSNKAEITNGIFERIKSTYHDIEHVANLGGVFLVTPTVKCISSGSNATLTSLTVESANVTRTNSNGDSVTYNYLLNITDKAFVATTISGVTWTQYGEVKVSGTINGIALGTCDGYIGSITTGQTTGTLRVYIKYDGAQTPATPSDITTVKELNVMLATIYDSQQSTHYPIGIWMKAKDNNGHSHISLYGGTSTTPTVRIGNLTDLPAISSGQITVQPQGWGIYTTHGYFSGSVVTNEGLIGGFTLYNNKLYTTNNTLGQGADNVYLSTDGISLGTTFKVTKAGVLTASNGTIGGWSMNSSYGLYTNNKTSATSTNTGILIQKDGGIYAGAYNSTNAACPFQVTSAGELTATSGTIGGWTIAASDIHSGTHNAWNHASSGVFIGNTRIAGGNGGTWYLDQNGTGKIGRWTFASNGDLTTTVSSNTAGMGNASYAFWAGAASGSASSAPFRVSYDGSAVFTNATIGNPSSYHVAVSSSDVGIFSDATTKIASYGASTTIGKTDSKNIYIDSQGLNIRTGSTVLAKYGKDTIIGSDHGQCIKLNNGGFAFYDYVEDTNLFSIGGDNVGTPRTKSGTYSTTTLTVSLDGFPKTGTAIKVGSTNAFTAGTSGTYTASSVTYTYDGGNVIKISRATAASNASYQFSYTADYIAEPVVTVGKADGNNFVIETDRLSANGLLNMNGASYIDSYWWIDDLMGETIKTTFTGDGSNKDFELDHVDTISSIKVNNSTVTNYSYSDGYIKFTTAPANGAVIVVSYTTDQCTPRFCFRNGLPTGPTTDNIWSVTLGYDCWSKGAYAFAGGRLASAEGFASVAHGYNVKASGSCACAFGQGWATGECSFAESVGVASGMYAHAEGCNTEATGEGAHSAGGFSVASGDYSFAGNFNTVAQRRSQTVLGEWNIADTGGTDETTRGSYAFIIGNGSATTESNALTVDWDGQLMAHGGIAGHGAYTGGRLTNANLGELGGDFKVGGTGMRYFIASSSMSSNKPTFKNLIGISYSNSDSAVLHLPWDYNNGYDTQIAIQNNGGSLAIRGGNGTTNGVQNWNTWSSLAMVGDFNPISIAFSHTSTAYAGTHQCWAYRVGNIFIAQIGFNITTNPPQGSYQTVGKFTLPKNINKDLLMIQPCSSGGNLMVNIQPDGTTRIYKYSGTCSGWIRGLMVGMWSQ